MKSLRQPGAAVTGSASTERVESRREVAIPEVVRSAPGAAAFVGLFSLLLRAFLLARSPFDGLYGQDAYFYLRATRTLEGIWTDPGKLWAWLTSPGTPPVSVWPLGYHIQISLASLLVGTGAESGQLLSLAAGVLTPVFTTVLFVSLATMVWTSSQPQPRLPISLWLAAVVAGLIVSASALSVRSSVVVMADMTGAMWATLGALLVLHYAARPAPSGRNGVMAGVAIGIAAITRYIYPLLALPALAQVGLTSLDQEASTRARLSDFVKRILPVMLPAVVLVGLQLLHNAIHPTPGLPSPVISNWSPANALARQFNTADGHLAYGAPMASFFLLRPLYAPAMLGLPFGVLALAGALGIAVKKAYRVMPLTLGWWLLFALFYSGNTYQADRFVLSYLPPLAVLAGFGFAFGYEALARAARALSTGISVPILNGIAISVLSIIVLVGLSSLIPAAATDYKVLVDGKNDYRQAVACLERAVGSDNTLPVLTFAATFTVQQYTDITARDLYYESPQSLSALPAAGSGKTVGYLLLPLNGFEAQWGGTAMGDAYRYITGHYSLERLSCRGTSFSLFAMH